ncbi:MAG: hypothetical protein OEZ58_06060 [Gammaproteobacteria bacterium]|nr:hypothetical protein [Gammaproteobacteria bacterium]MDH5728533.1 hypothetical protein [Gammaproteobacteria bacterium]
MALAIKNLNKADIRTVVMLRDAQHQKIKTLARQQNVSAAEIIRQAIDAYDPDQLDLETMADAAILSFKEAIEKVDAVAHELEITRAQLEK